MKKSKTPAMLLAFAMALSFALAATGCTHAKTIASRVDSAASATTSTTSATDDPLSSLTNEPATDDWLFYRPIQNKNDAINRIHDLLMRAGKEVDCKFEFIGMTDDGRYKVRGYEVVNEGGYAPHETTWFIYSIGEDVTVYDEILLCDVDPRTMERISG